MARLAATVTEETVERLRALAAQYGFIARAGRYIGEPSISELLDAIGDGRFAVVPEPSTSARMIKSAGRVVDGAGEFLRRTLEGWPHWREGEEVRVRVPEEYWEAVREYAAALESATEMVNTAEDPVLQDRLPCMSGEESGAEATDEED